MAQTNNTTAFKKQQELSLWYQQIAGMAIQKLRQSNPTKPSVDETLDRLEDVIDRLGGETTLDRVKTTIDRSKDIAARLLEKSECRDHATLNEKILTKINEFRQAGESGVSLGWHREMDERKEDNKQWTAEREKLIREKNDAETEASRLRSTARVATNDAKRHALSASKAKKTVDEEIEKRIGALVESVKQETSEKEKTKAELVLLQRSHAERSEQDCKSIEYLEALLLSTRSERDEARQKTFGLEEEVESIKNETAHIVRVNRETVKLLKTDNASRVSSINSTASYNFSRIAKKMRSAINRHLEAELSIQRLERDLKSLRYETDNTNEAATMDINTKASEIDRLRESIDEANQTKRTTRRAHEASVFKLRKCAETARYAASIIAANLVSSQDQVCRAWAAVENLQQDLRDQTKTTKTRELSLRKIVARFEDLQSESAAEIAALQARIEAANGRIVTLEEDSTAVMAQIAAREDTIVAEMEDLRVTILERDLQIGENADTYEEADRASTELLKNAEITINNANDVISKLDGEIALKTQDLRSMDDATELMVQRTASYQDAEKANFKYLETKSREREEDQSRALGNMKEKLKQLESEKREEVDRLTEKLSQLEARWKEEVDQSTENFKKLEGQRKEEVDRLTEKISHLEARQKEEVDQLAENFKKLEAQRKENVDQSTKKTSQLEARQKEEVDRLTANFKKLEGQRKEEVDRLTEKISHLQARQKEEVDQLTENFKKLEAQRKEEVDRLNEELGQSKTQKEQEANRLNLELGHLKTRTSEEVEEMRKKLTQAQANQSDMSDKLKRSTAKLDSMVLEKMDEKVMTSLTQSNVMLAGARKRKR